ncbi:uncharacterized protein LOC134702463 [Mytilus trossulus]|uniref:uncharacterized protein LOC134702463 n=1 Tax=Mytilus trossulus TaxID=6551 RepID=UPI00300609E1
MTRKSERITKQGQENEFNPVIDAEFYIRKREDKEGFAVREITPNIGKGVFTSRNFKKGDFLLEYEGELLSSEEGVSRLDEHVASGIGCYVFFFKNKDEKKMSIDGTFSRLKARYVNDGIGIEKNSVMKRIDVEDRPHLALFAVRDINTGEELRYDYGETSKYLPWRRKSKITNILSTTNTDEESDDKDSHDSIVHHEDSGSSNVHSSNILSHGKSTNPGYSSDFLSADNNAPSMNDLDLLSTEQNILKYTERDDFKQGSLLCESSLLESKKKMCDGSSPTEQVLSSKLQSTTNTDEESDDKDSHDSIVHHEDSGSSNVHSSNILSHGKSTNPGYSSDFLSADNNAPSMNDLDLLSTEQNILKYTERDDFKQGSLLCESSLLESKKKMCDGSSPTEQVLSSKLQSTTNTDEESDDKDSHDSIVHHEDSGSSNVHSSNILSHGKSTNPGYSSDFLSADNNAPSMNDLDLLSTEQNILKYTERDDFKQGSLLCESSLLESKKKMCDGSSPTEQVLSSKLQMTKKCFVSLKRFCISKLKGGRFKVGQPGHIGMKLSKCIRITWLVPKRFEHELLNSLEY